MQAVLQYPEFLMAALLSALLVIAGKVRGKLHLPQFAAQPAKIVLMSCPTAYLSWLLRMQNWAGWRSNSAFGDLAGLKVYSSILALITYIFLPLPAVVTVAALVFVLPDVFLWCWSGRRRHQILESLPQALDLMVLCVDAGLGLDATLQRISSERTAIAQALNDELTNLGRDVLLGMDRERAYQELYNRTGVDELKTLGSALNQSGKLGLSISKILRNQSEYMRLKQSQKAEEKAFKLPIYMAFPLWFCIMPALMVMVLAPSLIMFFQQVGFHPELFR